MRLISIKLMDNGNNLTALMHLYTLHELTKMHLLMQFPLTKLTPEQNVLLNESKNVHSQRQGKFDFLAEGRDGKIIGFEILTRPSQGKLKEKLAYAAQTDSFVFVLPSNSLEFYQRPKKKVFHKQHRPKHFGKEFNSNNLIAWLFDLKTHKFAEKATFNKVFFVKG